MSERTRFEAYITKHALTQGIQKVLVEDCFHISPTMVSLVGSGYPVNFHAKEWHRSEADAIDRAEELRHTKLKSLRKSIAKLEALVFASGKIAQEERT